MNQISARDRPPSLASLYSILLGEGRLDTSRRVEPRFCLLSGQLSPLFCYEITKYAREGRRAREDIPATLFCSRDAVLLGLATALYGKGLYLASSTARDEQQLGFILHFSLLGFSLPG